jgi:hypothetical protein
MGVQPPSDGVDEDPDVVEFGIAALDAKLESREVSYPVTSDALAESHGQLTVPVDASGNEVTLATVLERCDEHRFDSEQALLEALHPVFEAEREAVSRSILAQLRRLVPF